MLDDDELADLIETIDDTLAGLMVRYKIDPSELTGAMMARLMLMNQCVNNEKVFIDLLKSILENPPKCTQRLQ